MPQTRHIAIILLIHITASRSTKNTGAQVYEVINEQARMDDKRIQTNPGWNPLAGNQNAKLHAQNQQAMFNAERVRQHRAQLQRWTAAPIKMDSYMKAYHESQENHQLAAEQLQSNIKEKKASTRSPIRQRQRNRTDLRKNKGPDPLKITLDDAVSERINRNHRSFGSIDFRLQPNKFKTTFVAPGPTFDQGVTIKPNGNVGLTSEIEQNKAESQLFTKAISSDVKFVYPKQFHQMQQYESAQDIAALNSLLHKRPQDQLNELNALIHTERDIAQELETPIDLYFYLKDPKLVSNYAKSPYTQIAPTYASAYMPEVKDHTPISEDIDDIEDPNKHFKKPYTEPIIPIKTEEIHTNTVNFFNADPTINTKAAFSEKPLAQALKFEKLVYPHSGDTSERYLHHNAHFTGVQHLNEDGSGTSAYGDDVSMKNNRKIRSVPKLDTDPFIIPNNLKSVKINGTVLYPVTFNESLPVPEALRGYRIQKSPYYYHLNDPAGDTYHLDDPGDEVYDDYDENDDDIDYTEDNNDYLPTNYKNINYQKPLNSDLDGSFSQRYGSNYYNYRKQEFYPYPQKHDFSTSYGVPDKIYNLNEYSHKHEEFSSLVKSLEPVYMLTESQLKSLVGHHNLNIGHLDIYQWQNKMKHHRHRPRRYRKKTHRHVPKHVRKNLYKLHKLTIL